MKKYHWGVAGTGEIAHQFAESFVNKSSQLTAVASRNQETAETFAQHYQIPKAFGNYSEMLADPELDIVYIAVPNRFHKAYIIEALHAGKHVLCEKAITMDLAELEECIKVAEEKQLILQEAMTIFNMPLFTKLTRIIDSGKLGKLKMIQAPFGSYKEPDPKNRFFNPELAGGALLDIGTYAVSFARYFMTAAPKVVASEMVPFSTGVDEQSVTILRNEKDEMASVTLTFQAKMPKMGIVAFENGYINIPEYPRADQAEIIYTDGTRELVQSGNTADALSYEIATMETTIEGAPNKSLFLTKDVITLLDQMSKLWQK